jgi:hypothetical protein
MLDLEAIAQRCLADGFAFFRFDDGTVGADLLVRQKYDLGHFQSLDFIVIPAKARIQVVLATSPLYGFRLLPE